MLQRQISNAGALLLLAGLAGYGFADGQQRWDGTVETLPKAWSG